MRMLRGLAWVLILPLASASAWATAAIWIDGPSSRLFAGLLAAAFLATAWGAVFTLGLRWRGLIAFGTLFAAVTAWWLLLEPSNDRDWRAEVARLPQAIVTGESLTFRNLRNFVYRTENDFTEVWEERSVDLSQVVGADIFLCRWGSPLIAHTIMSWEFSDGSHLAVSIETRKEVGESYSAVLGFFRQYELYYTVADERDVIGLRTNHRNEQCSLYRLTASPEVARKVLLSYVQEINVLARRPAWYNALIHNCTTMIEHHAQAAGGAGQGWDWRIIVNGYLDEMGWERGTIATDGLSLEDLRARSDISAHSARDAPDFSARIRMGLPSRHPAAGTGS